MFIKRVKRKCSVRGCKNTDCFAISTTHEIGNTVIICKKCVESTLEEMNKIKPNEKTNIPKQSGVISVPPLFFNSIASNTGSSEPEQKECNSQTLRKRRSVKNEL